MTCHGLLPNHDAGTIKKLNLTSMDHRRNDDTKRSIIIDFSYL
jgi:hypothetical protein